jgi:dipeptidyl aminopeptidase/acylaminoacyl peptidase
VAGAQHRIYRYQLSTESLTELAAVGNLAQMATAAGAEQALLVRDDVSMAPEIWSLTLASGQLSPQSEYNATATAAAAVSAHPIEFNFPNGEVFPGFWFAPAWHAWPPEQSPVVFWQEGGPGNPMTNKWGTTVETPLTLLPSFGIPVVMVPLHHRPGATDVVWNALADGENFGVVDIDAMAKIARELVRRGWASADGLGLSGCSYGGYMTSQSIVRHPGFWDAANPQCSLMDLISEFQTGQGAYMAYLLGATPWDDWRHYVKASPGYHGDRVQTPTLIFHGTEDFLPLSIMENFFYDILSTGATEVRMLRFLGEGHGLGKPSSKRVAAQEQILWFRQHLR